MLPSREDHSALVAYLQMKVAQGDWHGVSDAANDLRVMEAQLQAMEENWTRPMFTNAEFKGLQAGWKYEIADDTYRCINCGFSKPVDSTSLEPHDCATV